MGFMTYKVFYALPDNTLPNSAQFADFNEFAHCCIVRAEYLRCLRDGQCLLFACHHRPFWGPIPFRDWEERNSPQAGKSFLKRPFESTRIRLLVGAFGSNSFQHRKSLLTSFR